MISGLRWDQIVLVRKFIFSVICVQSVIFATFHHGKVDGEHLLANYFFEIPLLSF